jgi:hypothetical protein
MTMQKIHFLSSLGKAPLEIDVPAEIENKLRWAVREFVRRKADLRGANLGAADLYCADLRGANLYEANLYGADLRGANLRGANLRGANLYEANLGAANLYEANLYEANLYGADLRGANLRGANLYGADLGKANLYGVDLGKANLYGVNLIPLPLADRYSGWAWRESEGSPIMISYGCHYGERSFSLPDARAYWAGKENRREIYAALDYAEAAAKIKGWL